MIYLLFSYTPFFLFLSLQKMTIQYHYNESFPLLLFLRKIITIHDYYNVLPSNLVYGNYILACCFFHPLNALLFHFYGFRLRLKLLDNWGILAWDCLRKNADHNQNFVEMFHGAFLPLNFLQNSALFKIQLTSFIKLSLRILSVKAL